MTRDSMEIIYHIHRTDLLCIIKWITNSFSYSPTSPSPFLSHSLSLSPILKILNTRGAADGEKRTEHIRVDRDVP